MVRSKQQSIDELLEEAVLHYGDSLRASVVHQQASAGNLHSHQSWGSRTYEKAWTISSVRFTWEIARPERDSEVVTTTCPHCGTSLSIRVWSIESMAKKRRSVAPALAILAVLFVGTLIGAYPSLRSPDAPANVFALSLFLVWPWLLIGTVVALLGGRRNDTEAVVGPVLYSKRSQLRTHPVSDSLHVMGGNITHHYLERIDYVHGGRTIETKQGSLMRYVEA